MFVERTSAVLVAVALFLTTSLFIKYAALMAIVDSSASLGSSRLVTVPLHIISLLCFVFVLLTGKLVTTSVATKAFFIFAALYLARLLLHWSQGGTNLYGDPLELIQLFFLNVILPVLVLSSSKFDLRHFSIIFWCLVIAGFIFVLFSIYFYLPYLGEVQRLQGFVAVSPLALSYTSTMLIAIIVVFWMTNSLSLRQRVLLSIVLVCSLVPFFLGASRGSVVAVSLVALYLIWCVENSWKRVHLTVVIIGILFVVVASKEILSGGLIARLEGSFFSGDAVINFGVRATLWGAAIDQFLSWPLFGSSIQVESVGSWPHNIYIEVLIATGLIGFIPFAVFLIEVVRRSLLIPHSCPQLTWVVAVFIVGAVQNFFTGYWANASIFGVGTGLVMCAFRGSTRARLMRSPQKICMR